MKREELPPLQQPGSARGGWSIEIIKTMFLYGPSIWTYRPALEVWVDIGELEDFPSNRIPGFPERLAAWLPSLIEHRCGIGERGGFLLRLRDGTWPAHILEHVMIELQTLAGIPTGFGKARETSRRGVYKVVVRTPDEATGLAALHAARDLVMAAIEDRAFDVGAAVERLREVAAPRRLGADAACIVEAADERRIPWMRLGEGDLVQLGYGARQRRIRAAETARTSAIGESLAADKPLVKRLLQSCGVPVAAGCLVESPEQAWEEACDLGLPVVVKPCDSEGGQGISTALSERTDIEAAYRRACELDREVLVERCIEGAGYRLLLAGGRLVAAVRRDADGTTDVTARVHPEVAATAALAARIVGLDLAGVDLVTADIARPLDEVHGVVLGLEARPALTQYAHPLRGEPQPVGMALVDQLFGGDQNGRIPLVGISGSHGRSNVARLVAKLLQMHGARVGLACADGLFLNQRQIARGDCTRRDSVQRVLQNRLVDAAVIESGGEVILSEGLGYDRCAVGVVTGIDPADRLPQYDINDAEQMTRVIRTQVDVVLPDGVAVLNAADSLTAALAPLCDGEVIFFASSPEVAALAEHRRQQGRAVFIRDGRIVFATGPQETAVARAPLARPAADWAASTPEDILAAAATAWALGLPEALIRSGLEALVDAGGPAPIQLNVIALPPAVAPLHPATKSVHANIAN